MSESLLSVELEGLFCVSFANTCATLPPNVNSIWDPIGVGLVALEIQGRHDDDAVLADSIDVQVNSGSHKFGDVNRSLDHLVFLAIECDVIRTDTDGNILSSNLVIRKILLLLIGELDYSIVNNNCISAVASEEFAIIEVHLRNADESSDEHVDGLS